jgi:hypothetical protein
VNFIYCKRWITFTIFFFNIYIFSICILYAFYYSYFSFYHQIFTIHTKNNTTYIHHGMMRWYSVPMFSIPRGISGISICVPISRDNIGHRNSAFLSIILLFIYFLVVVIQQQRSNCCHLTVTITVNSLGRQSDIISIK